MKDKAHRKQLGSAPIGRILLLTFLALFFVAFLYWYSGRDRDITPLPAAQKEAYFEAEIRPILTVNQADNSEALTLLRKRINAQFKSYRTGLEPFAQGITSWGARLNIAYEGAGELFSNDQQKVERFVRTEFEYHIVSEPKLKGDLMRVLTQFKHDMDASRNKMLVDLEASLAAYPELDLSQLLGENTELYEYVDREVGKLSKSAGVQGSIQGSIIFATGAAVEEVIRITVTSVIRSVAYRLANTVASSALAGGGAAATTTTAGGGGGSLFGPAGIAIGIGAGLFAGGVTDWWMTDRLEAKLIEQGDMFLNKVQKQLILDPNGLLKSLERDVALADGLYRKAVETIVLGGSADE